MFKRLHHPMPSVAETSAPEPLALAPPAGPMSRIEHLLQLAVIVLLCVGCWLVLRPFFTAMLLAAVVAVSIWPLYAPLRRRLQHWPRVAAVLGCLAVVAAIVGPAAILALSIGDTSRWLLQLYDQWAANGGPAAPAWLLRLPVIGSSLHDYWASFVADGLHSNRLGDYLSEPLRRFAVNSGRALAAGLMQVALAVLVLYFLLMRGASLGRRLQALSSRLGGGLGPALLQTARQTVISVMLGVVGTATAQAAVAVLGFTLAGVPHPLLLGSATFLLSMVPIGPPLIWGGATLWLLQRGDAGWAVFMGVYGMLCISSVDNVIKPYLISKGTHLPFVVTLLGVLGGLIAFGFVGLFLGPVLLALALNLAAYWLAAIRH